MSAGGREYTWTATDELVVLRITIDSQGATAAALKGRLLSGLAILAPAQAPPG